MGTWVSSLPISPVFILLPGINLREPPNRPAKTYRQDAKDAKRITAFAEESIFFSGSLFRIPLGVLAVTRMRYIGKRRRAQKPLEKCPCPCKVAGVGA